MFDTQGDIPENGFNRYMVECECVPFAYGIWWIPVLIDTWWNVNYKTKVTTSKTARF